MLKEVTRDNPILRDFIEWNGWGPPTSQFQAQEFAFYKAESEQEADEMVEILTRWMSGEILFKIDP